MALLFLLTPAAAAAPGGEPIVVAVLDAGIELDHPEFGAGQVHAWGDFTRDHRTMGGPSLWDTAPVRDSCPMGSGCHGTAMASLVGGARFGAFPGVGLAIGRVVDDDGEVRNLSAAVRWAARTAGADVILMSLGWLLPTFGALEDLDEAIADAHNAGALVVVAAGNGVLGSGPRTTSLTNGPAISPYPIVVGASAWSGSAQARTTDVPWSNLDPDVLAWGMEVPAASGGKGLALWSGTSVAAGLTAGWVASLLDAAANAGVDLDPARAKTLILGTAHDLPEVPPNVEGHGLLDQQRASPHATIASAIRLTREGADPPPPRAETGAWAAVTLQARMLGSDTLDPRPGVVDSGVATR